MSKSSSNRRKDELLGEPHGTAANRLRKIVLFKYVQLAGHDSCYRCSRRIERVDELSLEHVVDWQSAADPVAAFFDIEMIRFSHLRCNSSASDKSKFVSRNTGKTHCDSGHEFTAENTLRYQRQNGYWIRDCRTCLREKMRRVRRYLLSAKESALSRR